MEEKQWPDSSIEIEQDVRSHFASGEEYRSVEPQAESEPYETVMSQFLGHLRGRLVDVAPEKREAFEGLLGSIEKAALAYIKTRINFARAAGRLGYDDTDATKRRVSQSDQNRRLAHNALIDSLAIASRNFVKETGAPLPQDLAPLVLRDEPGHRERVADATIDYVWQDAFSPKKNCELWTTEWFQQIRNYASGDAVLVTYSVARMVRDNLASAGWRWQKMQTSGLKRSWLKATPA